jgi:autophagy-related protein 2
VSSTSTSTSSVSSSDSSTTDPQAEMYMSLAVADLRQSVAETVASGASVYQSALSERVIEEDPEGRDGLSSGPSDDRSDSAESPRTSIRGRSRSRSATPTGLVCRGATITTNCLAPFTVSFAEHIFYHYGQSTRRT